MGAAAALGRSSPAIGSQCTFSLNFQVARTSIGLSENARLSGSTAHTLRQCLMAQHSMQASYDMRQGTGVQQHAGSSCCAMALRSFSQVESPVLTLQLPPCCSYLFVAAGRRERRQRRKARRWLRKWRKFFRRWARKFRN